MHPQELANLALTFAAKAEADGMTATAQVLRMIGLTAWRDAANYRDMLRRSDATAQSLPNEANRKE
jgi:hypothetical protein